MVEVIVRYGEIALKGANRSVFEKLLVRNIRKVCGLNAENVKRQRGQVLVEVFETEVDDVLLRLGQVFGICWFARVGSCVSERDEVVSMALALAKKEISKGETFAVRASRADKNLPFTSKEIENLVGDVVRRKIGVKVDLDNPNKTIYINSRKNKSYVFSRKTRGLGGLPVGMSGKVLSFLSGGFDSIVASFLMAKRGAEVDFLHFHVFADSSEVLDSKISKIWNKLSRFSLSKRVYLASYLPFQMQVLDLDKRDESYELVVFRRLMVRVGEVLAQKQGYQALVLGDSLGQVASQTMENIVAVDRAVNIPIFRPLIGFDKQEAIDLVRQIGLEKEVNEVYKDCCSIISAHPATAANLTKVARLEERLKVSAILEEIAGSVSKQAIE